MTELLPCPLCGGESRVGRDTSSDYDQHWSWFAECLNYDECGVMLSGYASEESAVAHWNRRADEKRVLLAFYSTVCDQAERNMALTSTVSGAHWNAMRQVLAGMGIEVANEQ